MPCCPTSGRWSGIWSTCWWPAGWPTPFPKACREYAELLDRQQGRQRVEITTAVTLEPPEVERIAAFVSELIGREVVVTPRVDEAILGGLVVQIGDRLLDGSARARLAELRERLGSGAL